MSERKEYNKLVRDKIPQIIEESGQVAEVKVLKDDEYEKCLKEKLNEECAEFQESATVEELADVVEVIYALLDYYGVGLDDFEKIRKKKAHDRGAFKSRLFLQTVKLVPNI